jgi:heme-degrading monooxygenase HmoA
MEVRTTRQAVHLVCISVYLARMAVPPDHAIAVIFLSGRNGADDAGYGDAAHAMEAAAAMRDGYLGIDSVRGGDGVGITISWWRDEAAALAWRDDPDHARIRDRGRAQWYDWYRVIVATVDRAYEWTRSTG